MISEDEKREIRDSVLLAFQKYSYLRYQDMFSKANSRQDTDSRRFAGEDRFLHKRLFDIGLYMYTLSQRPKDKTALKHRAFITKAVIIPLAKGAFTFSDLGHGKSSCDWNRSDPDSGYTDRHKQRLIHEIYRNAFFETGSGPKGDGDGRVKHTSSVFSGNRPPSTPTSDFTLGYLEAERDASYDMADRLFLISNIYYAFPQFLEDLLGLRDECRVVFESLGESNERIDFLREQLTAVTPLLLVFYLSLTTILDLEWFNFRSKDVRRRFLESDFKIRYDRNDAKRAREMLDANCEPSEVRRILGNCGHSFLHYGRSGEAPLYVRTMSQHG